MKTKLVFVLCVVSLLTGCYQIGRFYPVQGPLAAQAPPPIFAAKLTGLLNSGNITVTLADGEVCKGTWRLVKETPGNSAADANSQPQAGLASAWDAVYGKGFYTANILGSKLHVRGILTGSKGTTLNVEFYRREIGPNVGAFDIKGVASDNKGNIYKAVF